MVTANGSCSSGTVTNVSTRQYTLEVSRSSAEARYIEPKVAQRRPFVANATAATDSNVGSPKLAPPELIALRALETIRALRAARGGGRGSRELPYVVYVATGSSRLLRRFQEAMRSLSKTDEAISVISTAEIVPTDWRLQARSPLGPPRRFAAGRARIDGGLRELSVAVDLWTLASSRVLLRYPGTSFSDLRLAQHAMAGLELDGSLEPRPDSGRRLDERTPSCPGLPLLW